MAGKQFGDQTRHIEGAILSLLEERGPVVAESLSNLVAGRASKIVPEGMMQLGQYHQTLQALLDSGRIVGAEIEFANEKQLGYRLNPDYVSSE